MSKAYVTAMVAGDLAPAAGSGHASYQDGRNKFGSYSGTSNVKDVLDIGSDM